ncbi:MAG TPA: methyltransferase domain-containing protein [Solirubrobacteraceae bacterium]|jgi:SAM-dependent methyltransferase|nr:methyltransferase domain-containing protein [Solirubrobacteraceae bacterium]
MRRDRWARVARGWESRADQMRRVTMPVSMWMVDAIEPQPGHTVLDLAAGIGDTGYLASELIQPGGTLITSDYLPEMLSAAQRRAEALGVTNVRFKQIDATQPIDLEAASVDAVLCRFGYMLMGDPEAALRETRRVLRPGGRLALAAWMGAQDNQWSSLPVRLLLDRGLVEPPEPGPGQFAWAEEGIIAEQLEAVGFVEYEVEALDFPVRYPSVEEWWATSRAMGVTVSEARIDDEGEILGALAAAAEPWTQDDGSLAIPARTWVAAATG